jgi:hypothetical protein
MINCLTFPNALFKVFDRDMVGSDDFMGQADFDLTSCEIHKSQEVTLHLEDGEDEDLIRSEDKSKSVTHYSFSKGKTRKRKHLAT